MQTAVFLGVAVSLYGLAQNTYWTLVFLLPFPLLLAEQALAVRTSTFSRRISLLDHQLMVETYRPYVYPSVDVYLPTAGEPIELLRNTCWSIAKMAWPGRLMVFILDDSGRAEVAELAREFGFRYLARPGSEYKKAGNLQYAFTRSSGDVITILDADFVPRADYLLELVPYLQDPSIGIVQSPQYFSTDRRMSWLERCAGATQEMFYRFIQPSRDAVGAAICVGTSALYRRAALAAVGGFPRIGHSEDIYTGIEMGRVGYGVRYVPVIVSRGQCPSELDSFINQQYRWCEGSMSLLMDPAFHRDESLTLIQRSSFWSGFLYYVTTAMNTVLAPLGLLVVLWFFPDKVTASNVLPILGLTLIWLVIVPMISHSRVRLDVLRVQVIYGYAHLFCILDLIRGRVSEWVATNSSAARTTSGMSLPARVRLAMACYISVTQVLIAVGLAWGAWRYGVAHYYANTALFVLNAYVMIPVGWLSIQSFRSTDAVRTTPEPARPARRAAVDDRAPLDARGVRLSAQDTVRLPAQDTVRLSAVGRLHPARRQPARSVQPARPAQPAWTAPHGPPPYRGDHRQVERHPAGR